MPAQDEAGLLVRFSDELADAVESAAGSVVQVNARRRHNPASGIVWSDKIVVTADHTLEREEDVTITLPDGNEIPASLVGRDPTTDIAILKFEGQAAAARKGPDPKVGHFVLAIGRPGSLAATSGVVSAITGPIRTARGGKLEGFLRSDANLYPGFSGGPLVDASGRVVGLNTTHFGGGLTIPVTTIERVVTALKQYGRIRRGYLGVTSQPTRLPDALAAKVGGQESGLLIIGLENGGPADTSGMLVGDILVAFAGSAIRDTDDLQSALSADKAGQTSETVVLRGGEPKTINVAVGERA